LSGLTDFDAQGKPQPLRIGHMFLAINVENFLPLEEFKKNTGSLLRELRAAKKVPGAERIYTAGEKEYYRAKQALAQGLEITPGLQRDLKALQKELGLEYDLGF
jgi:L-2-hydroxycarboxylate dehydrogenase (NAD+)